MMFLDRQFFMWRHASAEVRLLLRRSHFGGQPRFPNVQCIAVYGENPTYACISTCNSVRSPHALMVAMTYENPLCKSLLTKSPQGAQMLHFERTAEFRGCISIGKVTQGCNKQQLKVLFSLYKQGQNFTCGNLTGRGKVIIKLLRTHDVPENHLMSWYGLLLRRITRQVGSDLVNMLYTHVHSLIRIILSPWQPRKHWGSTCSSVTFGVGGYLCHEQAAW